MPRIKKDKPIVVRIRRASCKKVLWDACLTWLINLTEEEYQNHIASRWTYDIDRIRETKPHKVLAAYLNINYKLEFTSTRRRTVHGTLIGHSSGSYKVMVDRYISRDAKLFLLFKLKFAPHILETKNFITINNAFGL